VRPGTGREAGLGHAGSDLSKLPICLIVDHAGSDLLKLPVCLVVPTCSEIHGIKPRVLTQQGQADAVWQAGGKVTRGL